MLAVGSFRRLHPLAHALFHVVYKLYLCDYAAPLFVIMTFPVQTCKIMNGTFRSIQRP